MLHLCQYRTKKKKAELCDLGRS